MIRAPSVKQNDGQLSLFDMPLVLHQAEEQKVIKATDYPADTHTFILELMRAFQLCYASEEEKGKPIQYLVPELLLKVFLSYIDEFLVHIINSIFTRVKDRNTRTLYFQDVLVAVKSNCLLYLSGLRIRGKRLRLFEREPGVEI